MFGKHGSQLSSTMQDITLEWDEPNRRVVVKSSSFPSYEEWIMESGILKMVWITPDTEASVAQ